MLTYIDRLKGIGVGVGALAAIALTACSSSGSSTTSSSSGPHALTTAVAYSGPEASLPTAYPAVKSTGKTIKIGIACAACQVPGVALAARNAQEEIQSLGGQAILLDAGGDPQKQLNNFKQLLAEHVEAIIIQPLVESAMTPVFTTAKAAGVAVVTIGSPGDTSQPLLPGVVSNVTFGLDKAAFAKAQYLAMNLPKDAEIGVIGYGVPSDSVKYGVDRTAYWAQQFGLKIAQRTDASDLTVSAGQTAATGMLQRHPHIAAVVTFTDAISAGVLVAARQLNRPNVMACANDYDKNGYQVVSSGNGSCSVRWNWEHLGQYAAEAAYLTATKQATVPEVVTTGGGVLVTKANFETVPVVG